MVLFVNGVEYPRNVGLPPGLEDLAERWYGRETVYQSGPLVDQTYVRWYSKDKRHKGAISPKKMVELDAGDQKYDFFQRYSEYEAHVKARKAAEQQAVEEARGRVSGPRKDACIAIFEAKYESLTGPIVQAFPGWETRWVHSTNSGQTPVNYTDLAGEKWFLLRDITASLGAKIEAGEDISEMVLAGIANQNPELFSQCRQKATDSGEYVYRQDGIEPLPQMEKLEQRAMKKAKKLQRLLSLDSDDVKRRRVEDAPAAVASESDFAERPSLRLVRLYRGGTDSEAATACLKTAGAPDPAAVAIAGAELLAQLLSLRGFASDTEVVALFDQEGASADHLLMPAIAGFYFGRGVDSSGKLFYQKMLEGPRDGGQAGSAVICEGLYICWSDARQCWKVTSSLDDGKAGFAHCAADCPSPADASAPWSVLRADFPGLEKTGG